MSVTSIDSYENDYPAPRELIGNWEKTIILIAGESNIGKSQLSQLFLLNDSIYYISTDKASKTLEHDIRELAYYVTKNKDYLDAGVLAHFINDNCCVKFVDYFFMRFIKNNLNLNILIDGYLFGLEPLRSFFIKKCTSSGYRVWEIKRIL